MPILDPLLNNGYVLAALPFLRKAAPAAVESTKALHPLTYLPFHLVGHHLTARLFPYKSRHITYPAHLVFALAQYTVEHFSAEVPSVAAFGPVLVAIALSMAPYVYYRAFKTTPGSKAFVWAGLATFFPILFVSKGFELGFPKDTPEEQAAANLDYAHSMWHLLLHVALLCNQLLVSCGAPWDPEAEAAKPLVPPSPAHSTRRIKRELHAAGLTDEACSPASAKRRASGSAGNWAKAKAA